MKKLFLLVFAFAVVLTACDKDDDDNGKKPGPNGDPGSTLNPEQKQWGLVINYTAKWCGPCGSWGSPLLKQLAELNGGRVLAIAPHASNDPMHVASIYNGFRADRITGGGIPSFWVGDNKVTSQNASSTMNTLTGRTPIAAIDMEVKKDTEHFDVNARVKFFENATGDFYLSFYILEDGIPGGPGSGDYTQSGVSDPNYTHDYVPRKSYTQEVYGQSLASNPSADDVFDTEFEFTFDASWTNTVYVGAAIWRYNPNGNPNNEEPHYEFINGFVVK